VDSNVKRTRRIGLSLTESEYADIHMKAHTLDMSRSAYCRSAALSKRLPQPISDRQLLAHISRIGGNLNQVAHHLNAKNALKPEHASSISAAINLTKELRKIIIGDENDSEN